MRIRVVRAIARLNVGGPAWNAVLLSAGTRTVKVRVNVPNPTMKLRPGMFVRARLKVRLGSDGVVLDDALTGKWICYMHPEVVKDAAGDCDVCGMKLVTDPADLPTAWTVASSEASATFGDTYVSERSAKPSVVAASLIAPFAARQRSTRAPSVARHCGANAHVSCA